MFSGIVQGIGFIEKFETNNVFIRTSVDLTDCKTGSSICCNGVCLTASSINKLNDSDFIFCVNISEETRNRSNLFSQNLYQNAQQTQQPNQGDGDSSPNSTEKNNDNNVENVDYEVVEDDEKRNNGASLTIKTPRSETYTIRW